MIHPLPTTFTPTPFLTTSEAGALCQVSSQTIINWTLSGRLPFTRYGRGPRRIPLEAVKRLIENSKLHKRAPRILKK